MAGPALAAHGLGRLTVNGLAGEPPFLGSEQE